jgi:diguanylate cyclase
MDLSLLQLLKQGELTNLKERLLAAFNEHVHWMCEYEASLFSGKEIGEELLNPQAAQLCEFGRWYYGTQPEGLHQTKEFKRLGELHARFHASAIAAAKERINEGGAHTVACKKFIDIQADFLIALNNYLCDISSGAQLFDPLTKLLNRQEMNRLLSRERSRVLRTGRPCTIALADLDHFKLINDTLGHGAGDMVLVESALSFSHNLREYDLLFRYGGEEFLFCFPDTDMKEAISISERMRESIDKMRVDVGKEEAHITVSFGLAPLKINTELGESLRMADEALYEAKRKGRNQVCVKEAI